MNIRFYNAKILTLTALETFQVIEGELWVKGNTICYIGNGSDMAETMKKEEISAGMAVSDVFSKRGQADHGKYPPVGSSWYYGISDQRHYDQF